VKLNQFPTAETLEIVNELLRTATPEGAYSMGVISVLSLSDGTQPTRELLEAAGRRDSIQSAIHLYHLYSDAKAARG
jgi:hypothetical protein